jgi:hypothetical protein
MKKKAAATKDGRAAKAAGAPEVDPTFAPIVQAFSGDRRVTTGKMMGSVGLRVNGKVFAMHVKGRFVAKLPRARVDALVQAGAGRYFDPGHGRLMKEWVAVAGDAASWLGLAREAYAFVGEAA